MSVARVQPGNRLVGASLRRKEDPRFLRGRGTYVDDVRRVGMLHAAFVRSDMAHARLKAVDASAARQTRGVVGAFTAGDIASLVRPLVAHCSTPGYQEAEVPFLAQEKVVFAGQPIAIVVAESRHAAEDGAERIVVDYDPLPVVLDIDAASLPGTPAVHPGVPDNLYNHFHIVTGDIEAAFASADLVVDLELRHQRCAAIPMEGRALLAEWDGMTEEATVWISHQAPHLFRSGLALALGMRESAIRVISPDVGGGFGAKLFVYPEDVATIAAARLVGRPVKWVSDRREDLLTTMQSREQIHRIRSAVRKDGRVLGVNVTIKASNGGYAPWPHTAALDAGQASENVPGPYDIAAYERDVYSVVTNKAPMGPYRGVGRIAACFAIERTMDEIGRRLGLDPLEVRRRNVVRTYPYDTIAGLRFENGSSAGALDLLERELDLTNLRAEHARLRQQGIYRGIGMAAMVEHTALGPHTVAQKGIDMVLGFETATVRVEPDGEVTLLVGTHGHGQGHETTFAQIVADELGIAFEQVRVRFGDTLVVPYGIGTWASRSLVFVSGAAILACRDIVKKVTAIAAHLLKVNPAELVYDGGSVRRRDGSGCTMTFEAIARVANHRAHELPPEIDPGLEVTRRYRAPDPGTFSNSLHAAVVEVDIDTGKIDICRYIVIEDCGTMVNPMIVDGQIHGGVAQGLGQALLEDAAYDETGQPVATTLADYLVPSAFDVPRIEIHHLTTPSTEGLGGFKGMGEGGAVNPPAVIANAVTDALQSFGIQVNQVPVTAEWVVAAISAAHVGSDGTAVSGQE